MGTQSIKMLVCVCACVWVYVHVHVLLGETCWCMKGCDKSVREGTQSNTSNRRSMESRIEKPPLKVISLATLSCLSLSTC